MFPRSKERLQDRGPATLLKKMQTTIPYPKTKLGLLWTNAMVLKALLNIFVQTGKSQRETSIALIFARMEYVKVDAATTMAGRITAAKVLHMVIGLQVSLRLIGMGKLFHREIQVLSMTNVLIPKDWTSI